MKTQEVAVKAKDIKPTEIYKWTAEQLVQLDKEKALSLELKKSFSGRWTTLNLAQWLESRYSSTNNPGSVKMSCCNMLRAAIKRCE